MILPLHERASDGSWEQPNYAPASVDDWTVGLTDENLITHSDFGAGSYSWCQEAKNDTETYQHIVRGGYGASRLAADSSWVVNSPLGFHPVLELV